MNAYTNAHIEHAEAIEHAVDEIIETVLSDDLVEATETEGTPVSTETWLAAKAIILELIATIAGED
jgi:hypothetical protein